MRRAVWMLLCLISLQPPAVAATLTCVQSSVATDVAWDSITPLMKHLRDQGYRPQQSICSEAMLKGVIERGDADRLEAMIQANLPFFHRLSLNSNGGDVDEAMQIGRMARRYYLETQAPSFWLLNQPFYYIHPEPMKVPGAMCFSACFFAWLGGVNRGGELLGIHRPFPPTSEMQKLSPAEAEQLYRRLSDKIVAYLAEMGATSHWFNDMMRIPSDDIYMIPEKEIRDELEGDQRAYVDLPSFAQWKAAKCGALSAQEFLDLWSRSPRPANLKGYHDYLERRNEEILTCGHQAVIMARWQLHNTGGAN